MSHQPVIDGFEFASAGASQQGALPLSDFPRLADALASSAGKVSYSVKGMRDEHGRPGLRVAVRGTLSLRCQRCLEPIGFDVDSESILVLAATQAEIDAEPADPNAPDRVLAGREMPVRDLVEDELILALPYAPRHDDCAGRASVDAEARPSPFSSLRGLMRGRH